MTLALAVGALMVAGCGAEGGAEDGGRASDGPGAPARATTRSAPDTFFPQMSPGLDDGPTALLGGELILDGEGCLRVRAAADGPTWVPVWPADYRLSTGTGAVRVKGSDGRTVAEVGKKVSMGGGEVGLQGDMVDRSTIRELQERCPGEYWSVLDSSVGPPPNPRRSPDQR